MPTDTYNEEAKGVSKVWYVHKERLPSSQEIRIYQPAFNRAKERIRSNGLRISPIKITSEGLRSYNAQVYSVYGALILINELPFNKKNCCIRHAQGYLTIKAKDAKSLEDIANKLSLPLEKSLENTVA